MTPKQILDSFSETLMQDERILSAQERTLLTNLIHHARLASTETPTVHAAVNRVIASAVGETVSQRAFAVLGSNIVEHIVGGSSDDRIANTYEKLTHTSTSSDIYFNQSPGPQPPGNLPPSPSPSPGPPRPADVPVPPAPPRPADIPLSPGPPR